MLKSICLLLIIVTCVSSRESRDFSSVLSRLFNKRTKSATPLILVMDRNSLTPLQEERNSNKEVALDSSDENTDTLQHILQQLTKKRSPKPRQHRFRSHHLHRPSQRDRNQQYQDKTRSSNRVDEDIKTQSVLRSPIYKSLLTLRNTLRCGARSECQDDCGDSFKGKKKEKCEDKCEKKFECEEPEEEKDECENNDCEATEEEEQGSTKGVPYEPEPAGCKRC